MSEFLDSSILRKIQNPKMKRDIAGILLRRTLFHEKTKRGLSILERKSEDTHKIEEIKERIRKIDEVYVDEKWSDIYYKKRSIWCTLCTLGKWCTVVLSYKCHRDCFFCYEETPLSPKTVIDPNNKEELDRIFLLIDSSFSNASNKTLAITGGEPFLFPEKVFETLEYTNVKFPNTHTRIYTTGDIMTEKFLIQLQKLWLDEIRFSIKPGENPNHEIYALAKKYIPTVMIEMPVMPGSKEYMIRILTEIDQRGDVDGINLNELTFNNLNADKYKKHGLSLDIPTKQSDFYRRYYDVPKIEIGVYGSKYLCLELLEYFAKNKARFFLHYCDLNTVSHHHYLHRIQIAESMRMPHTEITPYWLQKILRIYGDTKDILPKLPETFSYQEFSWYVETSIAASNVFKNSAQEMVIIYKTPAWEYDVDFELD